MRTLLVLPPVTLTNSPYASLPYLAGYLRSRGHDVEQADLSLGLQLRILSADGLARIHSEVEKKPLTPATQFFLSAYKDYAATITPVVRFLQGKDASLGVLLAQRRFVPEGPRFSTILMLPEVLRLFGALGTDDRAKYIASRYVDDILAVVREGIDPEFGEAGGAAHSSFNPTLKSLERARENPTCIDAMFEELVVETVDRTKPDLVGMSVPFPANLFWALRMGDILRRRYPGIRRVMGGGYVYTKLRNLSDPRVFDFIDDLVFDDGERPLELIIEGLAKKSATRLRTWRREGGVITKEHGADGVPERDVPFKDLPGPDYRGLKPDEYLPRIDFPNQLNRLLVDCPWNKLVLAHGCYWKKCTFCDVHIDYVGRFEPLHVEQLIAQIKSVIAQTGRTGFHFVDEAAPPTLLKQLSHALIDQRIKITWWGNVRFDKQFTPEVASLMAKAGCVAVTGGLEVASPRLLKLINKGIDIEQAARVMRAFSENKIGVHAYLMYGFPTQTDQETIDSLEVVRQLFLNNCLHSGYWHRFYATEHSPVGRNPAAFNIVLQPMQIPPEGLFARYALPYVDKTPANHDKLAKGLQLALFNYMRGTGFEHPLATWFPDSAVKSTIDAGLIRRAIAPSERPPA
ncbi:MAG: radical SAM protein [Myxococcota bacterium]